MMGHGFLPFSAIFGVVHLISLVGFFYLFYNVAKSLRRIADRLDKFEQK